MEVDPSHRALRDSLDRHADLVSRQLILNPAENHPFLSDAVAALAISGCYASDRPRTREERISSKIQFAGREAIEDDLRAIRAAWATALGASDASLRPLSGLHAHALLFMAMATPGQVVLLLPTRAGGHMSGRAILERLGLRVIEMVVDDLSMRVDVEATRRLCDRDPPDFVFVDRSEGLVVEDLAPLAALAGRAAVYDASQCLANVLAGDHPGPFAQGFDLVISTLHKNFPGPQKALVATRSPGPLWTAILDGLSTYMSNVHLADVYAAGLTLGRQPWLRRYSGRMLRVAVALEEALAEEGLPVVRREVRAGEAFTHHLWLRADSPGHAFSAYEDLAAGGLLTNYRTLPYGLGAGLRLGTAAAVRLGLDVPDVPRLARVVAEIWREGATPGSLDGARRLVEDVWARSSDVLMSDGDNVPVLDGGISGVGRAS